MPRKPLLDVDLSGLDEPDGSKDVPVGTLPRTGSRRSPMGAAITESGQAATALSDELRDGHRRNAALARAYEAARDGGELAVRIALDDIHAERLERDRQSGDDEELIELVSSIRDQGLRSPIGVIERDTRTYELVFGSRRLRAFRTLRGEVGDAFSAIPAIIIPSQDDVELYRAMVDENLIRKDVSFGELGSLVVRVANELGASQAEVVDRVFASATRQKRAHIRQAATAVDAFGDLIDDLPLLPRNLIARLAPYAGDGARDDVRDDLAAQPKPLGRNGILAVLEARNRAEHRVNIEAEDTEDDQSRSAEPRLRAREGGKTTLKLNVDGVPVRITAKRGEMRIVADVDFTQYDMARIDEAIRTALRALEG